MAPSAKGGLPIVRTPTVDAAREQLGGRAAPSELAGRVVSVPGSAGGLVGGVVLASAGSQVDVWIGEGRVRRVERLSLGPAPEPVPEDLQAVAADARVFAGLAEGEAVRVPDAGGRMLEGRIRESCRFGALVQLGDGRIVAVGFRRLWPVRAVGGR